MVLPPLRLHDVRGERKALWGNAPMCRKRGKMQKEKDKIFGSILEKPGVKVLILVKIVLKTLLMGE